jgi:Flp pilus assembly protein CpaB
VQTRTKKGLVVLLVAAVLAGGLAWFVSRRQAGAPAADALDAIPVGALLVATVNLTALRGSPIGAPFLS